MSGPYRIGIVGFGVAGGALACLLARAGHAVTLLERAPRVGPIGAGLLLKPSGQQVLHRLGLLEPIVARSERLERIHAFMANGRTLINMPYGEIAPGCCAYGVHRGTLFDTLHAAVRVEKVPISLDCAITGWREKDEQVYALDTEAKEHGPYDFLVATDGSNSALRHAMFPRLPASDYTFGALWTVGRCTQVRGYLHQIVEGTRHLLGLLPIGGERCTFFWGLQRDELETVRQKGFPAWRDSVLRLSPLAEEVLADVSDFDGFLFTGYRHIRLRYPYNERIVCVGDAAHSMSPHLGQGASLALLDAECLTQALEATPDFHAAFRLYRQNRLAHIRYYALLSGLLTPFFQSNAGILGLGRDLALPILTHLPFVRRQMLLTMGGVKKGLLGGSLELIAQPEPVPPIVA